MSLAALLGAGDDNGYLTVAEGDAFASQALGDIAWNNVDEEIDKEKALVSATRWLDTLDYVGSKCDPAQPLKWPGLKLSVEITLIHAKRAFRRKLNRLVLP